MDFLNKNHSFLAFDVERHKTNSPEYSGVSKTVKLLITMFLLFVLVAVNAQKIEHDGKEYHVKGDKIFLKNINVTVNLTPQQQATIKNKLKNKLAREERITTAEKATKKAEKKQKKAEKKHKKAEKDLKKRKKAESNLSKSQKKYKNDLKKYEKLKRKGKLSSEDEEKWLKKLEKLEEKIKKNEKRLKRS